MSETTPSDIFRAYLAPLAVDTGSARIAERWAGVQTWATKGTPAEIPALVAAMRGAVTPELQEKLAPLFAAMVEADESFNTIDADQMVRLLAASALDHAFTATTNLDTAASLAVLTSSWGGRKPKGLKVDIVARAEAELDNIAAIARERHDFEAVIKAIATPPLAPSASAARINEGAFDQATVHAAFEEVVKSANKVIAAHSSSVRTALQQIVRRIEQSEEETDVLWHVFGGLSEEGAAFTDLDARRAAFFAGREIADRTQAPLRNLAAAELFRRCGAKGRKGAFAEAVEALDLPWIAEHASGDYSPSLFPIHRALARFANVAERGVWVAGWSQATGIAADLKVDPTELAVAFYRERLLLEELA